MFAQICLDYSSLPDPWDLTIDEIAFFYDAIRADLKKRTKKPEKEKK